MPSHPLARQGHRPQVAAAIARLSRHGERTASKPRMDASLSDQPRRRLRQTSPVFLLLDHGEVEGLDERAGTRAGEPRGGGATRGVERGVRFSLDVGPGSVGDVGVDRRRRGSQRELEPTSSAELDHRHRDAHQRGGGPSAVPHREVEGEASTVLNEILQRVKGLEDAGRGCGGRGGKGGVSVGRVRASPGAQKTTFRIGGGIRGRTCCTVTSTRPANAPTAACVTESSGVAIVAAPASPRRPRARW